MSVAPLLALNPATRVQVQALGGQASCLVFDDVLANPHEWVEFAVREKAAFVSQPGNAYPGNELALDEHSLDPLRSLLDPQCRQLMGVRRILRQHGRLAVACRAPVELSPLQTLCHVDRMNTIPGERPLASVLYLFEDSGLGGTGFYRPRRPLGEVKELLRDAGSMAPGVFFSRYGLTRSYMTEGNDWFDKVAEVPARFNRLILYPGMWFHSGDIRDPQRLDADPAHGRLTLNCFFSCRLPAS